MNNLSRPLGNQKGSAIVMALVASVVLAMAAIFAQQQAVATEKNLRHLRLRSLLTLREGMARTLLGQTSSYNCHITGGNMDFSQCHLSQDVIKNKINMPIPGCVPSPSSASSVCGIVLDESSYLYDHTTQTVTMRLVYNGTDLGLAPIEATTSMNLSFLASGGTRISCTADRPFLRKIGSDGVPQCGEISQQRVCPEGTYLKQLDSRFEASCVPITNSLIGCPTEKFMSGYSWNGGNDYRLDCTQSKLNPFARWPRQ